MQNITAGEASLKKKVHSSVVIHIGRCGTFQGFLNFQSLQHPVRIFLLKKSGKTAQLPGTDSTD